MLDILEKKYLNICFGLINSLQKMNILKPKGEVTAHTYITTRNNWKLTAVSDKHG